MNIPQKVYLSSTQLRQRYGNVSSMSVWRWVNHPTLGFPKPITIQRRNYWDESALEEWERKTAASASSRDEQAA